MKKIDRVLTFLKQHGAHTQSQMEEALGLGPRGLAGLMHYIRQTQPVRVIGWQRQHSGRKNHLRPIFVYGTGPDAKRPPPISNAEYCRAYKHRTNLRKHRSAAASDPSGADPSAGFVSQQAQAAP